MPGEETRAEDLINNFTTNSGGKRLMHVYNIGGWRLSREMKKRPEVIASLDYDAAVEGYLQMCEDVENIVNDVMMSDPKLGELRRRIEHSPDHGFPHYRRIEKWEKWRDQVGHANRHNLPYLYFKISNKLAKRGHDLVEAYTGKKEEHDVAAALFMYGYLYENREAFVSLINEHLKLRNPFFLDDWDAWTQATVFICQHHSMPEKIPNTTVLLKKGLVDPVVLLQVTKGMAAYYHDKDIYTLFPPFEVIRPFIDRLEQNEMPIPIPFNHEAIDAIRQQAYDFASDDKLDGTYPIPLAATRMFLPERQRGRAFYTRPEKEGMTLDEELKWRIEDGGRHESNCDFNRILFELSRTETLQFFAPCVQHKFRIGMKARSDYYMHTVAHLLEGNYTDMIVVYEWLERHEIGGLLRKIGVGEEKIYLVINMSDEDGRHRAVRQYIQQQEYDPTIMDDVLFRIHNEKAIVINILEGKVSVLAQMKLTEDERKRIMDLLRVVVTHQARKLPRTVGPNDLDPPYDTYYPMELRRLET